jgi:hypothetical protein
MDPTPSSIERRRALLDHMDWQLRPPPWFYAQLDEAIDLALEDRVDDLTELDGRRYPVSEVIEHWDLAEFVERIKRGEFELDEENDPFADPFSPRG